MPLTPQDVQDVKFPFGKKGYSEDDVDAFLDQVEAELTRLLTENSELRERLAAATEAQQRAEPVRSAPAQAAGPGPATTAEPAVVPTATSVPAESENAALRTLLMAQRTSDDVVAEARAEAEAILVEARTRAEAAERESQQRRASLEKHIEDLRAFEREYRTRLKAYLEAQLHDLEGKAAAPGAAAPRPAAALPATGPGTEAAPPVPAPSSEIAPGLSPQRPAAPFTTANQPGVGGLSNPHGSNADSGPAPA